jgi:hypothetical protein
LWFNYEAIVKGSTNRNAKEDFHQTILLDMLDKVLKKKLARSLMGYIQRATEIIYHYTHQILLPYYFCKVFQQYDENSRGNGIQRRIFTKPYFWSCWIKSSSKKCSHKQ